MVQRWADESPEFNPDIRRESFYILAAMQFGDPNRVSWFSDNAVAFYELFAKYEGRKYFPNRDDEAGATCILQYVLWYERDRPKT